ncbi:hypothetical protein KBB25_03055 [Candidatus Gracilibacteria bacterium]|nr:hypothetical protein [Candidatus Gracilibacteria bacterium]
MNFFYGLLIILGGIGIIQYRYKIHDTTGDWAWAEQYVGGTVNALVLIGMLMIGIGTAYPFGVFDDLGPQARQTSIQNQVQK